MKCVIEPRLNYPGYAPGIPNKGDQRNEFSPFPEAAVEEEECTIHGMAWHLKDISASCWRFPGFIDGSSSQTILKYVGPSVPIDHETVKSWNKDQGRIFSLMSFLYEASTKDPPIVYPIVQTKPVA
jgi:hypothetical protein